MIEVTRLDGRTYWINPHQIERIEKNPDVTLVLLSGQKLIIREKPDEIIEKIIHYRKQIGSLGNED